MHEELEVAHTAEGRLNGQRPKLTFIGEEHQGLVKQELGSFKALR